MKRIKLICLLTLAASLLVACAPAEVPVEPEVPQEPEMTAAEQYALGRSYLDKAEHLILEYTVEEKRQVGQEQFLRSVTGKASYSDYLLPTMTAVVEETVKYGSYESAYQEVYCNEQAYALVSGSQFCKEQSVKEFAEHQIPAVLLDSTLYRSVTSQWKENVLEISFQDPVGMEKWLQVADNAIFVAAEGKAMIVSPSGTQHGLGAVSESYYSVEYTVGDTKYLYSATVKHILPKALDLSGSHTEHFENAVEISDLRIPKFLMQTVGDVYTSANLSCEAFESIYSEAVPMTRIQQGKYVLREENNTLYAKMDYEIKTSDYRGVFTTNTQTDLYENGVLTTTVNDSEPTVSSDISGQIVRQSVEDTVLSGLLATKYLAGAKLTYKNNQYRLDMEGNQAFVTDLMQGISQFLQIDLSTIATNETGTKANGYLVVDAETGLPVALGLQMSRNHVNNDISYQLSYQLDHKLSFALEEAE